jgi:hypothetical protein
MNDILRRYIIEVIKDTRGMVDEDDDLKDSEEISEFSGVGAIAGFTAPLGMSGEDMEGPKVKERKKRKNPTWK